MSMNLMFKVKNSTSDAYVDFPYQTPTDLTYAVMREPNLEKRIKLIKDDLMKIKTDKKYHKELFKQCETCMRDETLELTYI